MLGVGICPLRFYIIIATVMEYIFHTTYNTYFSITSSNPHTTPIRRKVCSEELLSVSPAYIQVGQCLDALEHHSSEMIDTTSHEIGQNTEDRPRRILHFSTRSIHTGCTAAFRRSRCFLKLLLLRRLILLEVL